SLPPVHRASGGRKPPEQGNTVAAASLPPGANAPGSPERSSTFPEVALMGTGAAVRGELDGPLEGRADHLLPPRRLLLRQHRQGAVHRGLRRRPPFAWRRPAPPPPPAVGPRTSGAPRRRAGEQAADLRSLLRRQLQRDDDFRLLKGAR